MTPRRWALFIGLVVLALAAGTGGAVTLEEHDPFCAACHTEPETTYVRQIEMAQTQGFAETLAAFHALPTDADADGVRCIDCHGGVGVRGRVMALATAAGDTVKFVSGRYEQPARLSEPFPDETCIQCHADYADDPAFENHVHWAFAEEGAPTDIRCADCHVSHAPGNDFDLYLSRPVVFPLCEECHAALGRGPTDMGQ